MRWESRGHFFAVAATTMRRVLVDYARRRRAQKRGAEPERLPLEGTRIAVDPEVDLLDLEAVLARLEQSRSPVDPNRGAASLRGLSVEETAEALGILRRLP